MVNRLLWVVVLLSASTCSVYSPTFRDCSLHCSETGTCPAGTSCSEGFCRPEGFSGACDCSVGTTQTCGGGGGECKPGVRLCLDSRIWGPCLGEVKASAELCDGKDNDCDGAIDEAVSGAPACGRTLGVCLGATQACVDGGFVDPCPAATYGLDFQNVELTCDGLDNDCDGSADSRPSTQVAANVDAWTVEAVSNGYFLFSAAAGSTIISVQRLDEAFKAVGSAASIEVGGVVTSFEKHASNGSTVAVSFIRADNSVGVLRLTTSATDPVLLDALPAPPPQIWSLSVLDSGEVRAAVESNGGLVLASWATSGVALTITAHATRFPVDTISAVSLTNDGTVLAWDGDRDPLDGGSTENVGGIESLDGGRAVANSGMGRYTLVPTPGRIQGFRTFSTYFAIFPIAIDESGASYCSDGWQPSLSCPTVARIPDHTHIRDGTATRMQNDMVVGWIDNGTINVGTALPSVLQVRSRQLAIFGVVADFALAATPSSTLVAVFYRSQAEPTSVYGILLCPP